ncbi:MAG: hypothetical protein DWP97_08970 [Calditrichaeota bacterium]|nr:MAG: hypothetical protein DWP97_08970 [Calditrichota bacterium]
MFIGHYGVGFALKKFDSILSLGWLFIAVQLVDIFWTILIFFGIERVEIVPGITEANPLDFVYYPFTHSLVAFIIWSLIVGLIVYFGKIKSSLSKKSLSLLLGFGVFSHFILDLLVHRPDIPLMGTDSIKLGIGLWNYSALAYILEMVIFIGGVFIYFKSKKQFIKSKKIGLYIFTILLLVINLANLYGPPPENTQMIAVVGFISYILFASFGFWVDSEKKRI